jgi:hypothetical protein
MAACGAVAKLAKFVPGNNEALLNTTLRLLLNLSFDPEIQQQMVKNGLIPKLVQLIPDETNRSTALKLLYHLSMNDKHKSMFTFTGAIPMVCTFLYRILMSRYR